MLAIIDYGVGNLFSLKRSLEAVGIESIVTRDLAKLQTADQIILPGVGAFGEAIEKLQQFELIAPIQQLAAEGKPLLGICLGMQLLFDRSQEFGSHQGLGLIEGEIISLKQTFQDQGIELKVPHIGWNQLDFCQDSPLLNYLKPKEQVYYVHSFYAAQCEKNTIATSEYGVAIPGIVQAGNVFGCQFHPEKSGDVGLNILRAFGEVTV